MSAPELPFSLQTRKVTQVEKFVTLTREQAATILADWINRAVNATFTPEDVIFEKSGDVTLRKIEKVESKS